MRVAKCGATRSNLRKTLLSAALVLAFTGALSAAFAQEQARPAPASATATAPSNDAAYTAKIKEYTTEPDLLTELVDHLPASDTIPSPDKILGYVIGAPNKLTYTKDIYRYYRALAAAS